MKTIDIDDKSSLEELLSQIGSDAEAAEEEEPEPDYPADPADEEDGAGYEDGDEDPGGSIDLDAMLTGDGGSSGALAAVKKQLEEQRIISNELEDKLLRTQADFENFKRRTREEAFTKIQRSKAGLLKELLALSDNFTRAEKAALEDQSFENLLEGMNMLQKLLGGILEKEDVREIESVGATFDPGLHDCVLAVNSPDVPKETIIEEVEKGYIMGDTVLRPAKVIVSSGNFEDKEA